MKSIGRHQPRLNPTIQQSNQREVPSKIQLYTTYMIIIVENGNHEGEEK